MKNTGTHLSSWHTRLRQLLAHPALRWSLCAGYAGLVLYLSLAKFENVPEAAADIPHLDKIMHAVMYGGLMLLLLWAGALRPDSKTLPPNSKIDNRKSKIFRWPLRHGLLVFGAAAVLFGFAMELCQRFLTTWRGFEWTDAAANATGVILAALIRHWWQRWRKKTDVTHPG